MNFGVAISRSIRISIEDFKGKVFPYQASCIESDVVVFSVGNAVLQHDFFAAMCPTKCNNFIYKLSITFWNFSHTWKILPNFPQTTEIQILLLYLWNQ